jgi:hypothetical protein
MASQPQPGTLPNSPPPPVILDRSHWPWFCAAIERTRGRRLLLAAAELSSPRLSLWVASAHVDLIVYPAGATPIEQLRAIAHQAAHVLLGHQAAASDIATVALFSGSDELAADGLASQLVASMGLPPTLSTVFENWDLGSIW